MLSIIKNSFKVKKLEEENAKLKAENWVLRDSSLRTYDGMAMKADKYDILLQTVKQHIVDIKIFDNYSIIKESLKRLRNTVSELEKH